MSGKAIDGTGSSRRGRVLALAGTLCGMVLYMSPRSSPVVQVQVPHHNTTPTLDLPTARYIHRYSDEPPRALPRGGKTADPRDNPSAWFADWELASMGASQGVWGTCSPPAGTPERCCVGASSSGGAVRWVNWECTDADNHFKVPVPPPACTGIWNQSLAPSIRKGFLAGIQPHHHVQICRSPPPLPNAPPGRWYTPVAAC